MSQGVEFRFLVPVLLCRNLEETIRFYRDALGFEVSLQMGSYGGVCRGQTEIHLSESKAAPQSHQVAWGPQGQPADVNFFVSDVDALWQEFRSRGVVVASEPTTQSYGIRDMDVRDPNGYVLRFNQPVQGHSDQ